MRPKKDAKYLNVYIERKLYDEFSQFCEDAGQSKTKAAERALRMYIDNNGKMPKASSDTDGATKIAADERSEE